MVDIGIPLHRFTVKQLHRMRDTGILSPRARVELLGGILVDMHRPSARELEVKRRLVEVVARAFDADVVSSDPIHPEAYATFDPGIMVHDWEHLPLTAPCLLHRFSIAEFDRMLEVGRFELLDGVVRECQSAVFRRHREQPLPAELLGNAMRRLAILMNSSDVVPPTATLRERAGRLLGAHPLRETRSSWRPHSSRRMTRRRARRSCVSTPGCETPLAAKASRFFRPELGR